MSKQQRAAHAAATKDRAIPNQALLACVARLCPQAWAVYEQTGRWGEDSDSGAPYVLTTLDDGVTRRVQVQGEEGDVVGAQGASTADAIAKLAVKVLGKDKG